MKDDQKLIEKFKTAKTQISVGQQYYHYKNIGNRDKTYTVIGLAINEADQDILVIYKADYQKQLTWARPLSVFFEDIEIDGKIIKRFQKK